jgi:hypothetical protein
MFNPLKDLRQETGLCDVLSVRRRIRISTQPNRALILRHLFSNQRSPPVVSWFKESNELRWHTLRTTNIGQRLQLKTPYPETLALRIHQLQAKCIDVVE